MKGSDLCRMKIRLSPPGKKPRLAVMLSRDGGNLERVMEVWSIVKWPQSLPIRVFADIYIPMQCDFVTPPIKKQSMRSLNLDFAMCGR